MRRLIAVVLVVLSCASLALAQDPNVTPKWLKSERLGPLEVRWVDFGWTPEGFAAMESGGNHPAAGREWMLAMLRFEDPLRFEGRTIPVGPALLVLVPKRGEAPLAFDLREVDIRDMLFEPNIIGTPPKKGERLGIRAANFAVVPEVAERLDLKLTASGRDTLLSIHFGNRRAEILLKARE